jgi:hypothetical protein
MNATRNGRWQLVVSGLAALGLCLYAAGPAPAQFLIDFEPCAYQGSAAGTPITGQNGWYIPNSVGGDTQFIFSYDCNALGLPQNPFGDTQFDGALSLGDGTFPRAQLDFDWSQANVWTVAYDVCTGFNGTLPAFDNLSSFSLQDSTVPTGDRSFIQLNTWADAAGATTWNAGYLVFDASGMQTATLFPGSDWQALAVGNWYRVSTTFDLVANQILEVDITDLSTGNTSTAMPAGWYLQGGPGGGSYPLPKGLRFFVGGTGINAGNITGWDNLTIDAVAAPTQKPPAADKALPRAPARKPADH